MRWLVLAALLAGCKSERVAPSLPETESVGAHDLAFWKWFVAHSAEIAAVKNGSEPIVEQLGVQLHQIDAELAFELGVGNKAPHEIIISADGRKTLFPTVRRIVDAAPSIPGWKVIAFRPRKAAGTSIQMRGQTLGPDTLWFRLLPSAVKPGPIDLALYVPGVEGPGDRDAKHATFLLLDTLLGEYDTEMRIGEIQFFPVAKRPADARPLGELPALVDGWK